MYARAYRSYEYGGMASSIFRDQKRLFVQSEDIAKLCPEEHKYQSGCADWKRDEPNKILIIEKSVGRSLSDDLVLKGFALKYLRSELYINFSSKFMQFELKDF